MKRSFQDHLGRNVHIPFPPQRIVSLCPSLTETLFTLGSAGRIVGRTEYCVHPAPAVDIVPTVGGTKDVNVPAVLDLRPDLVVAEKEENRPEVIDALAATVPVYVFDVTNHARALAAIRDLGALTDQNEPAVELVTDISARFAGLRRPVHHTALYLIWKEPYMAAGSDTYIHSLLELCGLHNVCASLPGRYPTLTLADLSRLSPDLLLLSSEPFPFDDSHVTELTPHVPRARIMLVDGQMFGWYGSRMLLAADYLQQFLTRIGQ